MLDIKAVLELFRHSRDCGCGYNHSTWLVINSYHVHVYIYLCENFAVIVGVVGIEKAEVPVNNIDFILVSYCVTSSGAMGCSEWE